MMIDIDHIISSLQSTTDYDELKAQIGKDETSMLLNISIFGNYQKNPGLLLVEGPTVRPSKKPCTLLKELITWKEGSEFYVKGAPIHLIKTIDHNNDSYDIRHYQLSNLIIIDNKLILLGDSKEERHLRRTYQEPTIIPPD